MTSSSKVCAVCGARFISTRSCQLHELSCSRSHPPDGQLQDREISSSTVDSISKGDKFPTYEYLVDSEPLNKSGSLTRKRSRSPCPPSPKLWIQKDLFSLPSRDEDEDSDPMNKTFSIMPLRDESPTRKRIRVSTPNPTSPIPSLESYSPYLLLSPSFFIPYSPSIERYSPAPEDNYHDYSWDSGIDVQSCPLFTDSDSICSI